VGKDSAATSLKTHLDQHHIHHALAQTSDAPTIVKLRVLSHQQQMLRLDFESPLVNVSKTELHKHYATALTKADVVVLSDYGKGTLSDVPHLIKTATAADKAVFIDPKGQDFTQYAGATLITPNKKEFEQVVGVCANNTDIVAKAHTLISDLNLTALLVTCGGDGMWLVQKDQDAVHVAATSGNLIDVTGAGDTVIATLALAYASGYDLTASMHLANAAAGVVVSKSGTATCSVAELNAANHKQTDLPKGIVSINKLKTAISQAQQAGKTVVMTNGCFDLMHAGHVAYLEKAKTLGDYLVVAINSDASIKRIKGNNRPIAVQESREHVLAALQAVDWVVAFDEDTPETLLRELKPDILVKGTDYALNEIIGADIVLEYGGQVERISHGFEKYSTSQLIDKIKAL
jgi:D-beta-D-heptose 7-phosphate kinase/D-beta-D-heptose 1-phosphate adenosyltransferase